MIEYYEEEQKEDNSNAELVEFGEAVDKWIDGSSKITEVGLAGDTSCMRVSRIIFSEPIIISG